MWILEKWWLGVKRRKTGNRKVTAARRYSQTFVKSTFLSQRESSMLPFIHAGVSQMPFWQFQLSDPWRRHWFGWSPISSLLHYLISQAFNSNIGNQNTWKLEMQRFKIRRCKKYCVLATFSDIYTRNWVMQQKAVYSRLRDECDCYSHSSVKVRFSTFHDIGRPWNLPMAIAGPSSILKLSWSFSQSKPHLLKSKSVSSCDCNIVLRS
jgi:hypothetical protein